MDSPPPLPLLFLQSLLGLSWAALDQHGPEEEDSGMCPPLDGHPQSKRINLRVQAF